MDEKISIDGYLRVKEILKERKVKMKELAEQINITPESLTRALNGNPQFSTLKKIADYLDVPIRDLFTGKKAPKYNNKMRGCVFCDENMFAFNSRQELETYLTGQEDGMLHIPSYPQVDFCKGDLKNFIHQSINEKKSGAIMVRCGIVQVFTLTYEPDVQRFHLTQCISKGEICFKMFAVKDYLTDGDNLTNREFNQLLEAIHSEIDI